MHGFDWMLWGVEACGIIILAVWIAVPIREFKQIAKRLREKQSTEEDSPAASSAAPEMAREE